MSYLDPRGGYASSGDRSSDRDAPVPYYGVPGGEEPNPYPEPDPYTAYRRANGTVDPARPRSLADTDAATGNRSSPYPRNGPAWDAPTAATPTPGASIAASTSGARPAPISTRLQPASFPSPARCHTRGSA